MHVFITMNSRLKSYTLVVVQFACLVLIAMTGPIVARQPLWLFVEIVGLALGVWAIVSIRLFNFNITPNVKIEGYMVESGPYRYIRHPMYSSLLIICAALVANHLTSLRLLILITLTVDLIVKLRYEETLLSSHYPQYADYMTRTKRLLPSIW